MGKVEGGGGGTSYFVALCQPGTWGHGQALCFEPEGNGKDGRTHPPVTLHKLPLDDPLDLERRLCVFNYWSPHSLPLSLMLAIRHLFSTPWIKDAVS